MICKWTIKARGRTLMGLAIMASMPIAHAFEFNTGADGAEDTDSTNVKVRWDNTVKYSAARRIATPSPSLLANINGDDGDRNFHTGLISNRLDILSEMDVTYQNVGMRISGAAWYDASYRRTNNNDSPSTVNTFSTAFNQFTEATRHLHGGQTELLDAFAFAKWHLGDMPANFRFGKHTLLWGESLLLATNGISYAQAPLDLIKAQAVPGTQAKELFMPVGQVSGQLIPTSTLSFAGYYQYEWRKSRLPGAGSYFSTVDLLDAGGESLLLANRPGPALLRDADMTARGRGQWGISARYRAESIDTDLGLYYIQFHEKLPQLYLQPATTSYALIYPENIQLIGVSFSTTAGTANISGEMHLRHNTPLASSALSVPAGGTADNRDNPLYAVGDTLHAQISAVKLLSPSALWQGGSVLAEIGAVHRTRVGKNAAAIDPASDASAWGFSVKFSPSYFQVLPNLDINVPISLTYNPRGKSPLATVFNGDKTGTFSIGLEGEYMKVWNASLLLTSYLGRPDVQPLADRDFISFSVQRTF